MENQETIKLPTSIPDLIELAVHDAKEVEKMPEYEFHMIMWHTPSVKDKKCFVCMAGAVMARTLKADRTTRFDPRDFTCQDQLYAINFIREGDLHNAYTVMNQVPPEGWQEAEKVIQLNGGSRANWDSYLEAAQILRKLEREQTNINLEQTKE